MRKQNSLYNEVVTFINGLDIGNTYQVKDLIFFAGPKENVTAWKLSYNNPHYRIRSYQSMMGGIFIERVKYGTWRVIKKVPDWFDLGHLTVIRCYKDSYKGMPKNFGADVDVLVLPIIKTLPKKIGSVSLGVGNTSSFL
jgi:hypothetical protein